MFSKEDVVKAVWRWWSPGEGDCAAGAQGKTVALCLPARHDQLETIGHEVTRLLAEAPAWRDEAFNVQLAVHEACANVIDHAVDCSTRMFSVALQLGASNRYFCATIRDEGRPYHPNLKPGGSAPCWTVVQRDAPPVFVLQAVPEPGIDQLRGRGLFLMHALVDEIVYFASAGQNHWVLRKQLDTGSTNGEDFTR